MNCDTCGTALTEFNATNYRHVHDVGNCAQVLLAQRDNARAALESDRALLRCIVAAWDYAGNMKALIDEARARVGQ
jgi:hypothetical protein